MKEALVYQVLILFVFLAAVVLGGETHRRWQR